MDVHIQVVAGGDDGGGGDDRRRGPGPGGDDRRGQVEKIDNVDDVVDQVQVETMLRNGPTPQDAF